MKYAIVIGFAAAAAISDIWTGAYTDAQAKRGEALYADKCASCHAPDLTGIDQAAPLTGGDFMSNWNDLSMNDLFERVRISMPADKPGHSDPPRSCGRARVRAPEKRAAVRIGRIGDGRGDAQGHQVPGEDAVNGRTRGDFTATRWSV